MISEKIISMIKKDAAALTDRLIQDLLTREETRNYRRLERHTLYHRVFDVYSRLDAWLEGNKVKGEIRRHYIDLGRQRFHEEIPLEEALMALMLIKRHLWLYVQETNFLDSSFMLNQALEFNNRVVLFFDRAIYFTTMGFLDEMMKSENDAEKKGTLSRMPDRKQMKAPADNSLPHDVPGGSLKDSHDRRPLT